jgi:hypothetical protein
MTLLGFGGSKDHGWQNTCQSLIWTRDKLAKAGYLIPICEFQLLTILFIKNLIIKDLSRNTYHGTIL